MLFFSLFDKFFTREWSRKAQAKPSIAALLLLSLLLPTALLSGCASKVQQDVVTFHEGLLPRGETIAIEPMEDIAPGSQEFRHYRTLIADKLSQLGYQPVESGKPSILVARVSYSVSDGQTRIRSDHHNYVRYHFYYGHYLDPFYYGFYDNWPPEQYSYTVYNRKLMMNIARTTSNEILFEGRVQSIGREKEIAEVMPYMITAMFNNFPGESGITKVVTIEKEQLKKS